MATYPHDGRNLRRLVDTARARAIDERRSPVHVLELARLELAELVDALLSRPMLDAGPRSSFPLDLARSALLALVGHACTEAERGGQYKITSTLRSGLGVAAAARQHGHVLAYDVRSAPGCEDLEAIAVEAEHGAWICCGRVIGERFQGVHAADPLLAGVVAQRIASIGARREA